MLRSLTVSNFALIERADVELDAGLNVLSGETGAGKSILVDAFSAILGERSSTESIRTGSDSFRVEAVFDISGEMPLQEMLAANDIPAEEGNLIISRRLSQNGKNVILVNGCHVPVQFLRKVGELLVDVHGQHENQSLLRPEAHRRMLDGFSDQIVDTLGVYQTEYELWQKEQAELAKFEQNAREREQRLDMLGWQVKEITAADLQSGEEEAIEQELRILTNAEKLSAAVSGAAGLLKDGGRGYAGVLSALAEIRRELDAVQRYDERLSEYASVIADALYQLEDAAAELSRYAERLEYDPARLDQLQERLELIRKLKRKYGTGIDEILAFEESAKAELVKLENFDATAEGLRRQVAKHTAKLEMLAEALTAQRRKAASEFSTRVESHLAQLGMPKAKLQVEIVAKNDFGRYGQDEILFLFSANLGEVPRPLHKIASGGELSRMALAIKTVASERDAVKTMVFDEIDAGIGGHTAQAVGEKIAQVAFGRQVLCITHLPQIACMADSHIYLEKIVEGERTSTVIRVLSPDERRRELARMLSGEDSSPAALENAAHMLDQAKKKKETWKNQAQA